MVSRKKSLAILLGVMMIIVSFSSWSFAASSVTTESHSSTVLSRTMNFNVYLPPSYSTDTSKRYPVMYLLHGMGGSNKDWTSWGMQSIVDKAGGKEMVIIMPDALNDSFYVDGYKKGINYETYMFKEFIPYVESKYRIDVAGGKNRAVAGLSMGGFGASYYGFKYPDMFSSAYSMSGALSVTGNIGKVVNKDKYPAYTMECGTEDTLVGQMNVDFHNKLQSLGVPHDYITRSGSHSVQFWTVCLPKSIVFASKYFVDGSATPTSIPTSTPTKTNTPVPTVHVKPGPDLNGDKVVNMQDVVLLAKAFNSALGDARYKAEYDLNEDNCINMLDVKVIAAKFNTKVQ